MKCTTYWFCRTLPAVVLSWLMAAECSGEMPRNAFPGAEGFGAYAQGGRGGKVWFVTNVLDYAADESPIPGSLRKAIAASGPRTIVFRVSGLIALKSPLVISKPYL